MNTLISIIIPIYNGENHIDDLMEVIKSQTLGFENLEILFIDNKSTDNSKAIIKKYSDDFQNVKCISLEKHYDSPGKSRNTGIFESTSDLIMFCDQDDRYNNDFCEKLFFEITKYDVDMVTSRYTINDNGSKYINNSFLDKYDAIVKLKNIYEFPEVIYTQANLTIWNKIYKKNFLIKEGITFVEDHWGEDFLFSIEVYLKASGILLLNDYSGYNYIIDGESETRKVYTKDDFLNNCFKPLIKAKSLLVQHDIKYMSVLSEFLVVWIKIFIESNLNKEDQKIILINFKPWIKEYDIFNRLINVGCGLNILINVSLKLFSFNENFLIFFNKIYKKIYSN